MSELEDLGRYHQALERLAEAVHLRNFALSRFGTLAVEAAKPPVNRHKQGRRVRLDAMARLLDEAAAAQSDIDGLLAELAVLGPIVGKPVPELE